jgi:tRNA A37 methylthiotransferase MiaB
MVLATPAGISAEKAKRGAKHSQKIVVMKRMGREMSKSARFGDTKNSDQGEMHSRARHLVQGSKRACNYCLLRLYRGRVVGVSSMLL